MAAQIEAGRQIGHYVVEGCIGSGSEGQVYLARDSLLGRHVVLKTSLQADAEVTRRVEEARIAAMLDHPNLVSVLHAGRHQGSWFIVYELVKGGSVDARVQRTGAFSSSEGLELTKQAAAALSHMHERRVVHCDVKPQNLLLTQAGELKVGDFGLSLQVVDDMGPPGHVVGTPAFAAPELWVGGALSPASDVYSLGACLFYMLSGRVPFPLSDVEKLKNAHLNLVPRLPRSVPAGLASLALSMMAKDAKDRPGMRDVAQWVLSSSAEQGAFGTQRPPHVRLPNVADVSEPFAPGAIRRALRASLALGPEQAAVVQVAAWVEAREPRITIFTPQADYGRDVVELAIESTPFGNLGVRLPLRPNASLRTSLAHSLRLHGDSEGWEPLCRALRNTDASTDERGPWIVIEIHSVAPPNEAQQRELHELTEHAKGFGIGIVHVSPPVATPLRASKAGAARDSRSVVLAAQTASASVFADRLDTFCCEATAGAHFFSADAKRVLRDAVSGDARYWVDLARRSILVSAAARRRVVTSWAVLGARDSDAPMHRARDLIGQWGRPPAVWPTPDAFEVLKQVRTEVRTTIRKGRSAC